MGELYSRGHLSSQGHLISLQPSIWHECSDPNCPGAINRRKLEAAEELAILVKALCRAVRMAPTDRLKAGIDEDLAIRTQYFITEIDAVSAALSAWEKAGK